jgi:DNA-binding NarL/FixJ family response regulator
LADAIRVLVVDDHGVVREGLRTFLRLQDGIEVVGEAADGTEAVAAARELEPDVVLMDLVMPQLDGVEAMRRIRETRPQTRVIVLTSFTDDDKLLAAVRAGSAMPFLIHPPRAACSRRSPGRGSRSR